jgi:hypothetical protein
MGLESPTAAGTAIADGIKTIQHGILEKCV